MTPIWGWLAAYLIGFLAFQVLVYWYLQEDESPFERATPDYGDLDRLTSSAKELPERTSIQPDDSVRCMHCGAYNQNHESYTYCRECTEKFN